MVSEFSIVTTAPLVGSFGAALAELPFSMKNAPPPPPSNTTAAITMIISFFLDFFGASAAACFSSLLIEPLLVVSVGRGDAGRGVRLSRGLAGVQLGVGARGGRQQGGLVRLQRGEDDDVDAAVHGHRPPV